MPMIYPSSIRRDRGGRFCEFVSYGESDRSAEEFSGLSRRTFSRWCRQSPALAARYAQAVQARAALYRRRRSQLKGLLASARRALRAVSAKSAEGKAARGRVERLKRELADFSAAVCCVRLCMPRRLRNGRI